MSRVTTGSGEMTLLMVTKECPHTMSNQIEDEISQKKKKKKKRVNISLPCLGHRVSLKYYFSPEIMFKPNAKPNICGTFGRSL